MTESVTVTRSAETAAVVATFGLCAASWVLALHQMNEMGRVVGLGPFAFFARLWVSMMAAMMLPGAMPAVSSHARTSGRLRAAPAFVASYLAVWALVGIAIYTLYRPASPLAVGVVTLAAGVYELTPLKQHFRRRCLERDRSGFGFGLCCAGSSIGLMMLLVLLGLTSVGWMIAITAVVLVQKLMAPKAAIDVPVALAIVGFGIMVILAPSSVPGLITPM